MKGQKLMKHSKHLIGCQVQVTTMEWSRPDIPRAGVITGFGGKEGLFNVTVLSDFSLDIRESKSPLQYVTNVLVVDDDDDTPVGVHQYARIYTQPISSQLSRLISELYHKIGESTPDLSETEAPEETEEEVAEEDDTGEAEQVEESGEDDEIEEETEVEEKAETVPSGTPCTRLVATKAYQDQIDSIDELTTMESGKNEIGILLDGEDKPIARITWKDPPQGKQAIIEEPFGFTIKVRDSGGRCSRAMGINLRRPEQIDPVLVNLRGAILAALKAERGDYGSTTENMTEWINKASLES